MKYSHRYQGSYKGYPLDVKANSQKDLLVKIDKKKKQIESEIRGDITNYTVRQWSDKWMRTYVDSTSTMRTYKDIEARLEKKILPIIGHMKLADVKPAHCQEVLNSMAGYSLDRINKVNNTMGQMFKKAQANWLIDRSPAEGLSKPKAVDGKGRALSPYEQTILRRVCVKHEMGNWARIMLDCGARPGETPRMLWCHLKNGGIYIDGTKTKNAKRTVPVPDDFYSILDAMRGKPFDPIFTWNGRPLTHSTMTRAWKSIRREMQIEAGTMVYRNQLLTPYKIDNTIIAYYCRHTFATELKDAQMPYSIMQELLGHSTGSITDTYLHSTEKSFELAKRLLSEQRSRNDGRKESGIQ